MKLDRLIGILAVLLQQDRATAPQLAAQFEVSRRTIHRDMDALSRAGIPIVARQGAEGGYAIMSGYRIDRALLTRSDMQAILAGLRSLDSVSGTNRYAQLMEKLSAGASRERAAESHILLNLASWYQDALSEKIETLLAAIDARRTVLLRYHAPSGDSERWIEPYDLVFQWSSWYVYGWCQLRQDWRLFKLNRITSLTLGDIYTPRSAPLPDLSTERVFPARYHAVVLVHPRAKWRLIEEYGAGCYSEAPNGWLRFETDFTSAPYLLSWVLSLAEDAELLEPADLRQRLLHTGLLLQQRYGEKKEEHSNAIRVDG